MRIAVFGHDANHPDWQKRMGVFARLGHTAEGFMLRRGPAQDHDWPNTDLGESFDADFGQRIFAVARGAKRARLAEATRHADLIWARNLDMLGIAVSARKDSRTPIIYETLDIHESLYARTARARALRLLERDLLGRVRAILVSSPAFVREYYDRYHPNHPPVTVIENKLPIADLPARPAPGTGEPATGRPVRIGWIGMLRCARTLSILDEVATRAAGRAEMHFFGQPSDVELPGFAQTLKDNPHLHFHGPYGGVPALREIYASVDAVWAGDYLHADGNSRWLLPNRLYEGGYFGAPALIEDGREAADWVRRRGTGIVLDAPIAKSLLELLTRDDIISRLSKLKRDILAMPGEWFSGDDSALGSFITEATCTRSP
ncbi:MAG: hypothetical protein ACWA5T_04385 [Parvularcula sp.]